MIAPASIPSSLRRALPYLAAATTVVVIWLSLGNPPQIGPNWLDFAGSDKLKHMLAYATLGVLWSASAKTGIDATVAKAVRRPVKLTYVWLALTLVGALLEVLQWSFYPGRLFELADMLANAAGAALGCYLVNRTFPSNSTPSS